MDISIPELLVENGFITVADKEKIDQFSSGLGLPFVNVALNFGFINRKNYVTCLTNTGYKLADVRDEAYDPAVIKRFDIKFVSDHIALPLRIENNKVVTLMADPGDQLFIDFIRFTYDLEPEIIVAADLDITWMIHTLMGGKQVKAAVFDLLKRSRGNSALVTFSGSQLTFVLFIAIILLVGIALSFRHTLIILSLLISIFFLASVIFKLFFALVGSRFDLHQQVGREELSGVKDANLPVYTILLPVYKEAGLIEKLSSNMLNLDYPKEKLDIKLLVEQDDEETLNAIQNLYLPSIFQVIFVPFHIPRTKPKACNYALNFARGKYITVYDAGDVPDIDQLKKVVSLFNKLPANYICVQNALSNLNRNRNFLSRMLTLENAYLFDYIFPGLNILNIPSPFGRTGNHYRLKQLVAIGGWDAFNIAEDADLAIRAFTKKYNVAIVNSTTYKTVSSNLFPWLNERSVKIKGNMQSYLVSMRSPVGLFKKIGWKAFLGFNFFIWVMPLTFLIYPVTVAILLSFLFFDLSVTRVFFPDWAIFIILFNLVTGNLLMIYINVIGVFKRGFYGLILFAIANPLYWLINSLAAYNGLVQLVINPYDWGKESPALRKVKNLSNLIE